ncbi:MAG TPA: GGDEF domain-containing protein, partial [Candidatus Limnocylindria bacterium]|nr:GGDEF domain-containing protein [Candidatus Limnocylindria bacterium]
MLSFVRALGFLAPLVVAALVTVGLGIAANLAPEQRPTLVVVLGVAAAAGMTTMALLAWSYVGWRLSRIAQALERTLESDEPINLREVGIPAERRLARAFNAASGAFVQTEARATHDRLTGIPNRETLLATLSAELERAVRHYKPLSVAFIDIDRFKPINDTYGHNSGDAVLRQVASLIADNIRASDLFGRYGGEEFMLILPETQHDEAVVLAEKLRTMVAQKPLVIAGNQHVQATISIGVAGDIGSQLQVDTLVDQA